MKRCPECRRDYYDETLLYCLDDGTPLLDGPASGGSGSADEPRTAILDDTDAPSEAKTRAQIHTTAPPSTRRRSEKSFNKRLLLIPTAFAVISIAGYFGYRFFSPARQIASIAVLPFVNE